LWTSILSSAVSVAKAGSCRALVSLAGVLVSHLHRSNFEDADGRVGHTPVQVGLVRLVSLLFAKLPSDDLSRFELATRFVGQATGFVDAESVSVRPTHTGWHSTGMWLPPGTRCAISLSREAPSSVLVHV
jgi:hypothetical protein